MTSVNFTFFPAGKDETEKKIILPRLHFLAHAAGLLNRCKVGLYGCLFFLTSEVNLSECLY